jgi:hypothetical protein
VSAQHWVPAASLLPLTPQSSSWNRASRVGSGAARPWSDALRWWRWGRPRRHRDDTARVDVPPHRGRNGGRGCAACRSHPGHAVEAGRPCRPSDLQRGGWSAPRGAWWPPAAWRWRGTTRSPQGLTMLPVVDATRVPPRRTSKRRMSRPTAPAPRSSFRYPASASRPQERRRGGAEDLLSPRLLPPPRRHRAADLPCAGLRRLACLPHSLLLTPSSPSAAHITTGS